VTFKDHFSGHADRYTRYRPHYPTELFQFLAEVAPQRTAAWDAGTGNGQAAVRLAEFFDTVFGSDPSARQIEQAFAHPGVRAAESCPLPDDSIDLVTVAQAAHWFDLERFYAEVRRVCRPRGVLAVWAYGLARIAPEIDAAVYRLYEDVLGAYWPPERRLVEQGYTTLVFPFSEIAAPKFAMTANWDLADLIGYLDTWSSAQNYRRQQGRDPLDVVRQDLDAAWRDTATRREVRWPLYLRIGRIEV
jgi:SAM-dependent methyltransferase